MLLFLTYTIYFDYKIYNYFFLQRIQVYFPKTTLNQRNFNFYNKVMYLYSIKLNLMMFIYKLNNFLPYYSIFKRYCDVNNCYQKL